MKVIEKHVDFHLTQHDDTNNLNDPYQSAYTKGCSTETALLRVQSDLLMEIDARNVGILILLDLSAAFDTIDHATLITRLKNKFGIIDGALQWIKSYMSGRMQCVTVNGERSNNVLLKYGVPQGSTFGPKAFKKYDRPLGFICEKHGLRYHIFADDTQIYIFFKPGDDIAKTLSISRVQSCIEEIKLWMATNYLKHNEEKTEIVVIKHTNHSSKVNISSINIGDSTIEPSPSARNLGVIFDSALNMEQHIANVCKKAWYELRKVSRLRKFLTEKAAITLVHAFVTSKLDYCNALMYGLPDTLHTKLQRVMNSAARIVMKISKFDSISPVLKDLHWLKIPQRVEYKILLLTFKALHGLAPMYLQDLIQVYTPPRALRSADLNLLFDPKVNLKCYGERAFVKASPGCWNRLPRDIRFITDVDSFKRAIKTHLFEKSFK